MGGDYFPLSYEVGCGCLWGGAGALKVGFRWIYLVFSIGETPMD